MPDRLSEKNSERSERKRINSAVVVSKSFQKVEEKRDRSHERRERHHRQRSADNDSGHKAGQRMRMDHDADSREHRRLKMSERLGPRPGRRGDMGGNNEEEYGNNWRDRKQRNARRGRGSPPNINQQRQTVFDRLDAGPTRDRGFMRNLQGGGPGRDQRMIEEEVEVNPQDVPRGKRYFMHDDRELPRRQQSDRSNRPNRSRARSRSPLWVHDKFDVQEEEDEDQEDKAAVDDNEPAQEQEQDNKRVRDKGRDRERTWRVHSRHVNVNL